MSKKYNDNIARKIRRDIIEMSYSAKVAHIPSALSMCDYLGVLFKYIHPQEYKFILGKPFGAQAYYALFAYMGWIPNTLEKYGNLDNEWRYIIQKEHPLITYIDETMGNCLSVACGIALTGKKTFVNISDAAFQEGTIWESVLFAGAKKVKGIVMAIDSNNMQALGKVSEILPNPSLGNKIELFGWKVFEANGHDYQAIDNIINEIINNDYDIPVAIVFNTCKGKGVIRMEEDFSWHYRILDETSFNEIMRELL